MAIEGWPTNVARVNRCMTCRADEMDRWASGDWSDINHCRRNRLLDSFVTATELTPHSCALDAIATVIIKNLSE